jgi:hypothetical protein
VKTAGSRYLRLTSAINFSVRPPAEPAMRVYRNGLSSDLCLEARSRRTPSTVSAFCIPHTSGS